MRVSAVDVRRLGLVTPTVTNQDVDLTPKINCLTIRQKKKDKTVYLFIFFLFYYFLLYRPSRETVGGVLYSRCVRSVLQYGNSSTKCVTKRMCVGGWAGGWVKVGGVGG